MGVQDLFVFLRQRGIPYERHRPSYFARSTVIIDGYSLFFRIYYAAKKISYKNHREKALDLLETFLNKWPPTTTLIFVLDNPVKSEAKKETLRERHAVEEALQKELRDLEKIAEEQGINPVIKSRQEALRLRSKETFPLVARDMIDDLKKNGYRVLVAEGEAERAACEMVLDGQGDYVYSNDSDCLALSCPAVIFEDYGGYLHVLRLESVLTPLGLDADEFTDFCILLGTDFNKRIFGPDEAYTTIVKYRQLENIPDMTPDVAKKLQKVRSQYRKSEETPPRRSRRKKE